MKQNKKELTQFQKRYKKDRTAWLRRNILYITEWQDTTRDLAENYLKKWTAREDREIRNYRKKGRTILEIAILLGRTYIGTKYRIHTLKVKDLYDNYN